MLANKKSIFKRTVSGLLAFLTVFTLMASLSLVPVFADESEDSIRLFDKIYKDYYTNPDYDPEQVGDAGMENPDFTTPEKRIEKMEKMYSKGHFELYVDKISGEVALKDTSNGDILFSNPYDISEYSTANSSGVINISSDRKADFLSQVNISYSPTGQAADTYDSFTDSALLGQITVKKLRGGVRVEYSIGEEQTRALVPRCMSKERYTEMIYNPLVLKLTNGDTKALYADQEELTKQYPVLLQLTAKYENYKISKATSEETKEDYIKDYPALKKYGEGTEGIMVYTGISRKNLKQVEAVIKMYCTEYTFEEMDKDHLDTNYTANDKAVANFRMALEYYINDFGVEVRFPANGLSFDESAYELNSISILPCMGAGVSDYLGYNFVPDGSGMLMRFEDVAEKNLNVTGKVYGDDYAYQELSGANKEVFRMPVFGVVTTTEKKDGENAVLQYSEGRPKIDRSDKDGGYNYSTGYFAIITEGDALASITSINGGQQHPFNYVYCSLNPRPKDTYNLAEAISIGGDSKVTVVSERKYTGAFKINYIMLTDPAKQTDPERTYYDTSYVGMAKAYRDFLENGEEKIITKLTEQDVNKDNIPFYIEAFGVTEAQESFLSIPVTVKKALTTFDQLETMIDECQSNGINNIGLKLTGYTNGGMYPTVPTKVKFEKAVGGNDGFTEFLKTAASKGVSVYPEFDFAYMYRTESFDGFSYSTDAVKTIDNRYITKREYSAVLQTFSTTGKICISPCVYRDYFETFDKSFKKILGDMTTNVSLGSLGSDLNSDFDDDDPYNREDSKNFTLQLLESFKEAGYGNIMVNSGNAYAMKYADIVLDAPLDSSRYAYASEAIPFFGMVYHGYIVFAGSPTNMVGDINYEILKILENGATLYMMLSYDNVELLKKDEELSKYYAISYEIWKKTLFDTKDENGNVTALGLYSKLNNALKDVQTSTISDHKFINCMRKFTDAEIENILADATKLHNTEKSEKDATLNRLLNKRDIYLNVVTQNKDMLEAAGAVLKADDEAKYNEIMTGGYDTVQANQLVLQALVDAGKTEYQEKLDKYNAAINQAYALIGFEANSKPDDLNTVKDVADIFNKIAVAQSICSVYVVAEGETYSARLKELIALKEAEYYENRIVNDGSVVYVEYENGKWFVLNYNSFIVEVETPDGMKEIGAKDFVMGGNA